MERLRRNFLYKNVINVISFTASLALFLMPAAWAQPLTWTPTQPMHKARAFFTATELQDGNILVAGGYDRLGFFIGAPPIFPDAEIYDWHTGSWTVTASMNRRRSAAAAVRLEDGRVLVTGGLGPFFKPLSSSEIYDPKTGLWSFTGSMNDARAEDYTCVLLPGKKVLVAGGTGTGFAQLDSAEIYDEKTGVWSRTANMHFVRGEFASVVLHDGRVLVAGGLQNAGPPTATAEIYDPPSATWTLTGSMSTPREDFSMLLLLDGRVLVSGGTTADPAPRFSSAEIFDPHTDVWVSTGSMTSPRSEAEFASVLLPDGRALVTGGFRALEKPQAGTDIYDPKTETWSAGGKMSTSRAGHAAVVLRGNRGTLVMGGLNSPPLATKSADIGK